MKFKLPHHSGCRAWRGLCLATIVFQVFPRAAQGAPGPVPGDVAAYKKLSLEELMGLEVTSVSRRPEKLSETASAIQVITQEDIRRSGATRLPEALRLASNLEVAQINARDWAVSPRGFNSSTANELLVLIDGRAIYSPLFSGVFWDVQDTLLADVDRIEVISGPGGTLWGANAVNGVVNITTKSARETQGWLVEGGGGNALRGFGGVRYGGKLGTNVAYRVYGKFSDRDGTLFASGRRATNDWFTGQGGFRLDWDASEANLFTLQGDLYNGRLAQPGTNEVAVSGGNVMTQWKRTLSEDSDIKLQWYFDRTRRDIPRSFSENVDTYDIDFQHRFPIGQTHDFVWGLGYRLMDEKIGNTPTFAFLPAQVQHQVFSGFAQDEIGLVKDRLNLTLGTKIEHNQYTGLEFQPSVRMAWKAGRGQTLWGAISRAVRTPSRIDHDLYAPPAPPFTAFQGGPNFVSEELLAYELGYRFQPRPELSFSLAGFYNDYDHVRSVELVAPPAPAPIMIGNGLRGYSYGAELTANYHVAEWWRLRAGLTELRIHLGPRPGSTDTSNGSVESHDPQHQFSLHSAWDLPGHFEFDTACRYLSQIANQGVPPYWEMDLRLAWQATPNLEFSIVGQNLLHSQHAEFGAPAGRQEIERSVYGKVLWRF